MKRKVYEVESCSLALIRALKLSQEMESAKGISISVKGHEEINELLDKEESWVEIVKILIKAGADVNIRTKYKPPLYHVVTPLWDNINKETQKELIMILLKEGANASGIIPYNDDPEIVEKLINAGADINECFGMALSDAVRKNNEKVVEKLIALGIEIRSYKGLFWSVKSEKIKQMLYEKAEKDGVDIDAILSEKSPSIKSIEASIRAEQFSQKQQYVDPNEEIVANISSRRDFERAMEYAIKNHNVRLEILLKQEIRRRLWRR